MVILLVLPPVLLSVLLSVLLPVSLPVLLPVLLPVPPMLQCQLVLLPVVQPQLALLSAPQPQPLLLPQPQPLLLPQPQPLLFLITRAYGHNAFSYCSSWVARAIIRTYIWNVLSGSHQTNVSNKIYVPRVLVELLEIRLLVQGCRRPSSVDIACAWPLSVFTDASGCAWTSCQCHTIALLVLFHSTRRGSSSVSQ